MTIKGMKKWIIALLGLCFLFVPVTLGRYMLELGLDDVELSADRFYFRSNVLVENTDMSLLEPVAVNGKRTSVTIANGAGEHSFSDSDITWTLRYYVDMGEGFVPVPGTDETHQLERETTLTTETLTITPVSYEGVVYNDVIVEAKSVAPYQKTLRVRLQFAYQAHSITYAYQQEAGVITLQVTTNADAGRYTLNWKYPLIPDNADPTGILATAQAAPDDNIGLSLTAELAGYTTYRLYFFIDPEMRSYVDEQIASMTDEQITELIKTVLLVSYA